DPERFLQLPLPSVRPFFGRLGLLFWLLVVGTAMLLAAVHWHDLTEDFMDRVLVPHNLLLLWLVFPVLKTLHEFGHAFATKAYGGGRPQKGGVAPGFIARPPLGSSGAFALLLQMTPF